MAPEPDYSSMSSDIIIKGHLRKAKAWNKRFFVLRESSPARLEYYDNERKWKSNSKPKKMIDLDKPWNIDIKKDSKRPFLIVIFTEDEYFSMAADNAETQLKWLTALRKVAQPEPGSLLFKHMWYVNLDNKELDPSGSNVVVSLHGPHRVCLTHDTMVVVPSNSMGGGDRSKGRAIEIQVLTIRACGHKENSFFIVPGRSSGIGSGKLWMDVGDETMAFQMHNTIYDVMSGLNDQASGYRNRSYSSGSNSGRMRSVRSHINNPPPSQIGMGKMPGFTTNSKRIRCDSLPAPHAIGLNENRLRTGSEGENTMKKPARFHSMRTSGSISPGMRNRLLTPHGKQRHANYYSQHLQCHHCPHPSHYGSCNSSSTTSSSEHLNFTSSGDYTAVVPATTAPSPANGDAGVDENAPGNSPTQTYIQVTTAQQRNGSGSRLNKLLNGQRSSTPDFSTVSGSVSTPPIQENTHSQCPSCIAHLRYCTEPYAYHYQPRVLQGMKTAPPPPNVPPPNPTVTPASEHEYANFSVHSRTQSMDDSLSCSTAASSLSASPLQHFPHTEFNNSGPKVSHGQSPSQVSIQDDDSYSSCATISSSVEINQSYSSSLEDYSAMTAGADPAGKYPHHAMTSAPGKSRSGIMSTMMAKLTMANNQSDYTPMIQPLYPTDSTQPDGYGYVPMRPVNVISKPQDIGRRRSVPDNMSARGNAHYGYSPDKPMIVPLNEGPYSMMCASSPNYNCHLKLDVAPGKGKDPADPVRSGPSCPTSTPLPANGGVPRQSSHPRNEDYLSMHTLGIDLPDHHQSDVTAISSSPGETPAFLRETEIAGYLPMSPLSVSGGVMNGQGRKSVFSNILTLAEPPKPLQYPHQRQPAPVATATPTGRAKRSVKNKRPKSLAFRHSITESNRPRRTHSLRMNKRVPAPEPEKSQQVPTVTSPEIITTQPDVTARDYVNMATHKAPVKPFALETCRRGVIPASPSLQRVVPSADYTDMSFSSRG